MAENATLMAKVKAMDIGDMLTVPCSAYSYNTVRRYTCDLGFIMNRRYTAHLDRPTRTFIITRHS